MSSRDGDHQIFWLFPLFGCTQWRAGGEMQPQPSKIPMAWVSSHMSQLLDVGREGTNRTEKMLLFLMETSHMPMKSDKNTNFFDTSIPNNRLSIALNFSAAAAPVLSVQVPGAGISAGHKTALRRDPLYLLCANSMPQNVQSLKAGWQAWETLNLARGQQKASLPQSCCCFTKTKTKQTEQQSKFPIRVYKLQTTIKTKTLQQGEVLYFL